MTEKGPTLGNLFEANQERNLFEAERRLLQEVLADAIECWQARAAWTVIDGHYAGGRQRLCRQAEFWIFGEYDNTPFFSFTKICDCLGLDADFIRRRLLEWKKTQAKACGQLRTTLLRKKVTSKGCCVRNSG
jgi:hypothetical protein